MQDQDTKKPNTQDDLGELKSLTQGAEDMGFSLDDILAEYGTRRSTERSAAYQRRRHGISAAEPGGDYVAWPVGVRP